MPRDGKRAGALCWKHVFVWLLLSLSAALLIREEGCFAEALEWENGEEFSEDLLVRPLSDGKVLSHFYFKNTLRTLGSAAHHHVFPKAISQLVHKFHIREMEISFTQGRWNYERWGALDPIASSNAKPLGVELWAAFDVPLDQVDPTWRNLTHALSGLFCASINFLESPAMVAAPDFAFGPDFSTLDSDGEHQFARTTRTKSEGNFGRLRYGALPREAVCTENLTPWLKLLPCRDKAGISTLLDRPSIYRGHYHCLRVRLHNSRQGATDSEGTVLEQTLTLVLQPSLTRERSSARVLPHWSLTSLFGRRLEGSCPLAKTSHVLLELEGSLVQNVLTLDSGRGNAHDKREGRVVGDDTGDAHAQVRTEINVADNTAFNLSPYPDGVFHESKDGNGDEARPSSILLDYWLEGYNRERSLNLGMLWKEQVSWPSSSGPFRVSRFLVGSGNQKGSIMIQLQSNYDQNPQKEQELIVDKTLASVKASATNATLAVAIFHMVPWYVRLYTHTLTASVDGFEVPLWEIVTQMRILPAEDRLSLAVLEIQLQLCMNISTLSLNVEFDKGFLHIDEHPPDANRGFDLPSALISFPTSQTQRHYRPSQIASINDASPFLQALQDGGPVHIYSESLLVPLATPDFSMPYNVITFTCTILALYFGSLLNTLRRRIGEEERKQAKAADLKQGGKLRQLISHYMEGKTEKQKKLTKLFGAMIIVAIAITVNHFLNMG